MYHLGVITFVRPVIDIIAAEVLFQCHFVHHKSVYTANTSELIFFTEAVADKWENCTMHLNTQRVREVVHVISISL
jgi:hypothetical protein